MFKFLFPEIAEKMSEMIGITVADVQREIILFQYPS